jgi:hypothetical protein
MAGVVGALAGVAVSACFVEREGAPCDTDDNCPRSQYCDLENKCVEHRPSLDQDIACELVLITVSQKLSACAGGRAVDWKEGVFWEEICSSVTKSITAGRMGYDPMKLRACRASVTEADCADLATRKAGQYLADCPMLTGSVASGGSCATDKDCAAGYCNTSAGCLGSCRAFVSNNVACTATDVCEPGSACTNGTCKPYITSGSCSDGDAGQCQPWSHYCPGGQCTPRRPAGTSGCDYTGGGFFCESKLNCAGALLGTRVCQPGGSLESICTPFTNQCDKFTYCQTHDGGNFCTLLPGPGDGCGLQPPQGAQDLVLTCLKSRCDGLRCVNYNAQDTGCGDNTVCGPLARCVGGACRSEFCR